MQPYRQQEAAAVVSSIKSKTRLSIGEKKSGFLLLLIHTKVMRHVCSVSIAWNVTAANKMHCRLLLSICLSGTCSE